MPDYKTNDPKGWCGDPKRGAAMGRPTIHELPKTDEVQLYLRLIRLNTGGYDINGTYFGWPGSGWRLYWYASEDLQVDAVVTARDREHAKLEIRRVYSKAMFFN